MYLFRDLESPKDVKMLNSFLLLPVFSKKNSFLLLPVFLAAATYCYYQHVSRTMRTAIVFAPSQKPTTMLDISLNDSVINRNVRTVSKWLFLYD